jgi:hypothetical protein
LRLQSGAEVKRKLLEKVKTRPSKQETRMTPEAGVSKGGRERVGEDIFWVCAE